MRDKNSYRDRYEYCELKTIIIHIYNKVRSCFHSNVYCIQYCILYIVYNIQYTLL